MEHRLIRALDYFRRRVLSTAAMLCALAAVLLQLAWLLGVVASDRFAWSQPFAWVPGLVALLACAALLILSSAAARLSTRLAGLRLRAIALLLISGATVWVAAVDLELHELVGPAPAALAPGERVFRLGYFNASGRHVDPELLAAAGMPQCDLLVIANTSAITDAAPWAAMLTSPVTGGPGFQTAIRRGPFNILLSGLRYNTVASGAFVEQTLLPGLALKDRLVSAVGLRLTPDGGSPPVVMESPGAGTALGAARGTRSETAQEELVVWLVDLPSHPAVVRAEAVRTLLDAMRRARGRDWQMPPRYTYGAGGFGAAPAGGNGLQSVRTDTVETDTDPADARWWLAPDIVAGDFNAPSRSWSLGLLADAGRPLHGARDDLRTGPAGTWPMSWTPRRRGMLPATRLLGIDVPPPALWSIDLVLGVPRVRFIDHRVVRVPGMPHGAVHATMVIEQPN